MRDMAKRTIQVGLTFGAIVGLIGCEQPADDEFTSTAAELQSENGLTMNGLTMNGLTMNGLTMNGLTMNGLTMNGLTMNGLNTVDGLSSTAGLMTTAGGRDIVKYMVKCALPAGQTLTKQDQNGVSYDFPGAIGVAPEAMTSCNIDCQEKISACMLAHVNNSGAHIGIWLVGADTGIGWGSSPSYPYQEGAYFGNLFPTNWQGYYCVGKDMGSGEVPGRLGAPISTSVYANAYGYEGKCNYNCTTSNEGYSQCNDISTPLAPYTAGHKWGHVITVWRNFESTQLYKICTKSGPTRCLGVASGSTADGAAIEQRTYSGALGQQWQILQVETGKYKFVNMASGKVLDTSGTTQGTAIVQRSYSGAASQKIPVVYFQDQPGFANLKPSSGSMAISADDTADGRPLKLTSNNSPDYAKFGFTAIGTVSSTPVDPTGAAGTTGTAGSTGSTGAGGSGGSSSLFAAGTPYRIAPKASNGSVSFDLSGGSTTNGNLMQLYTSSSTSTGNINQRMQFMAVGSNWKIVMNSYNNKCFDIGANNGNLLVINDCNGGNSQAWTPTFDSSTSSFTLKNVASGRCLDIPNGSLANTTHPQAYDCSATNNNQKFLIWASP